jgi:hypothetical protein
LLPKCIDGFEWGFNAGKTVKIKYHDDHLYVNDIQIKLFDASNIITLKKPNKILQLTDVYKQLIKYLLNITPTDNLFELNLIARKLHINTDNNVFDWIDIGLSSKIDVKVWKNIFIKLQTYDTILIGPIDRQGNGTDKAIDYYNEGIIWRVLNVLSLLYPHVIIIKTEFKFNINKNHETYYDLIDNIKRLIDHGLIVIQNIKPKIQPKIITNLWDHQNDALDKIVNKIKFGNKGIGDASCVGSGKTLVALSVIAELCWTNKVGGNLILLPNFKLYKTWIDEINKHTIGFNVISQNSNGSYEGDITYNTIFITTIGRMRDHPLNVKWNYVVIDECLTVQNKEALQTEEAWRQIMCSNHGVLMLSATFLRARFDKLYFLLKMLRTGLPEERNYLNAILGETIICNVIENDFIWNTNTTKFTLDVTFQKEYNDIMQLNLDNEKKYIKLTKYLFDHVNYINHIKTLIEKFNDRKLLIYTRSEHEETIVGQLKDVSIYPDKSKRHIVTTYVKGSAGVNDLVDYNCIITRPIEFDKITQMKGRIARPGQKEKMLYMEYFIIKDTIEEANIYRIEFANKFHNEYIMPLSVFYNKAMELSNKNIFDKVDKQIQEIKSYCQDGYEFIKKFKH